jgi:hypothetical protein
MGLVSGFEFRVSGSLRQIDVRRGKPETLNQKPETKEFPCPPLTSPRVGRKNTAPLAPGNYAFSHVHD